MSTKNSPAARFAEIIDEPSVEYARPVVAQQPTAVLPARPLEPVSQERAGDKSPRPSRKRAAPSEGAAVQSRVGKVGMQGWLEPNIHRALKVHAAMTGSDLNAIFNEAIFDFMKKHKIAY